MLTITPYQQNHINFKAKLPNIPYEVQRQSSVIISAVKAVNPDLQKLASTQEAYGAKKALGMLKQAASLESVENNSIKFLLDGKKTEISLPNPFTIIFRQTDKENQCTKEVEISQNTIQKAKGFSEKKEGIIEFLTSMFEELDFPLLQLRRKLGSKNMRPLLDRLTPKAVLNEKDATQVSEIRTLFNEIHALLDSIKNQVTKSKIKYGYENIRKDGKRPKEFEFTNIEGSRQNFSINTVIDRNSQKYLVIRIGNDVDKQVNYIIDSENHVLKEMNLSRVLKIGDQTIYYSQEELNFPSVSSNLSILKSELEKYKAYLQKQISRQVQFKEQYSTGEVGSFSPESLKLIEEVKELFNACKTRILKIKEKSRKDAFKEQHQIFTIVSSPSLIFKYITENNEHIALSFPVMKDKQYTKLILLRGKEIKESLFVEGDKLIKFNAKDISRSHRHDIKTNYHSQEEIDNCGLEKYLELVKERLLSIPNINKYISN